MINKSLNPKSTSEIIINIISFGVFSFFILVFLFSRSFVGISIFGFRIGELSMVFPCLQCLFFYFKILEKINMMF